MKIFKDEVNNLDYKSVQGNGKKHLLGATIMKWVAGIGNKNKEDSEVKATQNGNFKEDSNFESVAKGINIVTTQFKSEKSTSERLPFSIDSNHSSKLLKEKAIMKGSNNENSIKESTLEEIKENPSRRSQK